MIPFNSSGITKLEKSHCQNLDLEKKNYMDNHKSQIATTILSSSDLATLIMNKQHETPKSKT